jgi:hypothetical protein
MSQAATTYRDQMPMEFTRFVRGYQHPTETRTYLNERTQRDDRGQQGRLLDGRSAEDLHERLRKNHEGDDETERAARDPPVDGLVDRPEPLRFLALHKVHHDGLPDAQKRLGEDENDPLEGDGHGEERDLPVGTEDPQKKRPDASPSQGARPRAREGEAGHRPE